ncbi:MAG: hypothetical protein D6772_05955 [Bacteroidetes bacterium]|nr:MAG: hypothetical protein D6772_05955 [Bacteroidota bacterium]
MDYLDVAKFEFYAPYRVRCQSSYTTQTEFQGRVSFYLPNRIQIDMQGPLNSHYQIILDIPPESELPLKGVYSGITQSGQIAAGRVLFDQLDAATYHKLIPRSYSLRSPEAQHWITIYDLEAFFTGEQDEYVDNARAFKDQLTSIFEGSTDFKHLPGVYYYYRTRTIRGHMREVKRFPMLLRPNGEVVVKIKSGGEAQIALGTAVRIKECIYIHLKKQDRYDGLAILWPPSLRNVSQNDEIIPALYVSNSKRFHITAGRLFFIRQFSDPHTDEALFAQLQATNICMDEHAPREQLSPKERVIVQILQGQLNNYMAIRDANELNLPDFRTPIFHGACYLAEHGHFEQAFETLYLALLRAGFRDIDLLIEAFAADGPFANQELAFRQYCNLRYDPIHGQDQRGYLEKLFEKIFPFRP